MSPTAFSSPYAVFAQTYKTTFKGTLCVRLYVTCPCDSANSNCNDDAKQRKEVGHYNLGSAHPTVCAKALKKILCAKLVNIDARSILLNCDTERILLSHPANPVRTTVLRVVLFYDGMCD